MFIRFRYLMVPLMIGFLLIARSGMADNDTANIFSFFASPSGFGAGLKAKGTGCYLNLSEIAIAQEYHAYAKRFIEEAKYDSAGYYYQAAYRYFESAGDMESCCRCLLDLVDYSITIADYNKAKMYMENAETMAHSNFDRLIILNAEVDYIKGKLLIKTGERRESIKYLENAIKLRTDLKGPNDPELATVYNTLGVNYYYIGNLSEALTCYNKALTIKQSIGSFNDLKEAEIFNNIGIILKLKGDFIGALDYYQRSLAIKEELLNHDDPNLGTTYNNIGNIYRIMGKSDLAMLYYTKAVDIYKISNIKSPSLAISYVNKGVIYMAEGDFGKALELFNCALNILDEKRDAQQISTLYNNIGNVYYKLNEFEKALVYYKKSVLIREIDETNLVTLSFSNYAKCYDALGEYDLAEKYYKLAINSIIKYYGREHYLLGLGYENYGYLCIENNKYEEGLKLYQQAYSIYLINYGRKSSKTSNCLTNIGEYYLTLNKPKEALEYLQKALVSCVINFDNDNNIYLNPNLSSEIISKPDLLNALHNKAQALNLYYSNITHDLRDMEMSLKTYEEAIDLVDIIRIGQLDYDSKLELAKNQKDLFYEAINVAYQAYGMTGDRRYLEMAFNMTEKGKAGMLYDFIRESDAKHYANIPDSLLEKERKVKEEITLYENLVYQELQVVSSQRDSAKIALWNEKLFRLRDQQKEIVDYFNVNYPKYYEYKYNNRIYSLGEVQQYLTKKDVLLEYFTGREAMFVFEITRDAVRIRKQALDPRLFADLENLPNNQTLDAITNDAYPTFANYLSSSYDLYRALLQPFEQDLQGRDLIIIPDGKLGYVSFESLLTKHVEMHEVDYRNLPYLINDHAVSYGYSTTLLVNSRSKVHEGKARENLVAFAPVVFNTSNYATAVQQERSLRSRLRDEKLLDLPGTKQEVLDITRIVGGDVYLNDQATVTKFKEIASRYKILHIATHGIVDDNDPLHSRLMFSPSTSNIDGGCLQYNDLFNLELNADLAVLSACNTGAGRNSEGEGIIALSRGFLYSGVPSLVISLWKVEDEATATIMKNFYKYLKQGKTKDEALRLSKLEYLHTTDPTGASPYYWSSFVNIGNKDPLHFNRSGLNYLWLLLILLPLPACLFHLRRKNNHRI